MQRYIAVPQKERWADDSDETLLSPGLDGDRDTTSKRAPASGGRVLKVLFGAAYVACIIASVVTLSSLLRARPPPPAEVDIFSLERPSMYIDLDRAARERPLFNRTQMIKNLPYVVARISHTEPNRAFPSDTRRWLTPFGTQSPEEDNVFITQDVSTVIQTRVTDYGMERCSVVFELPSEEVIRGRDSNNNVDLLGDVQHLAVYALDVRREIDPRTVSRSKLPPRGERIGSLNATIGTTSRTPVFPCSARQLVTFEIACETRLACMVRFVQDKDKPIMGLHLEQYSSL